MDRSTADSGRFRLSDEIRQQKRAVWLLDRSARYDPGNLICPVGEAGNGHGEVQTRNFIHRPAENRRPGFFLR